MSSINYKKVKTRKPHNCWGCGDLYPEKSILYKSDWADEGTVLTSYICNECNELLESDNVIDYINNNCNGGLEYMELRKSFPKNKSNE